MAVCVHGSANFSAPPTGTLVAIGNFDGVHRGHAAVLSDAVKEALAQTLAPVVLTFEPHPRVVLGRGAPEVLTPLDRKLKLLAGMHPELAVVVEPFTEALSRLEPRQFVEEVLVRALSAKVVVVGDNFRFGKARAGDLARLSELGAEYGYSAHAHALVSDEQGALSSTRIRAAIRDGEVELASRLLGRPHALTGRVVKGARRGRTLGTPTANLDGVEETNPAYGVYTCVVDRLDGEARALRGGVVNVGDRPTVNAGFGVEVHLFDFEGDLYGATLRVHLLERLRAEERFVDLDALREQISRDVTSARSCLARLAPVPAAFGTWF